MFDSQHYFDRSKNIFSNYFIALTCCLLIFEPIQLSAQSKFQFGPTLGIGVCSMHDKYPADIKMHFHTGIIGSYAISRTLKLQPSLVISTKGYGNLVSTEEKVDLIYTDGIFTMKYQPWKILFIGFGTQVGYLISASYRYEFDPYDQDSESLDIKSFTNDFDYGLNGSVGCQFKSGIGLELGVVYGLRDVYNKHSNEPIDYHYIPEQAKGKNLVISISFYALFGKKQKQN